MLNSLTISLCLAAIAAEPGPPASLLAPEPPPAQAVSQGYGAGGFQAADGMPNHGIGNEIPGEVCAHCGHRHSGLPSPFHDWVCPRCNMSQRFPYWPQYHGNYYFRPYHMQRVIEQRQIATSWGEDPRNPYGNLVFDRVYEQMRADEAAQAEALPDPASTPASPALKDAKSAPQNAAPQNSVTPKPLPKKNTLDDLPDAPPAEAKPIEAKPINAKPAEPTPAEPQPAPDTDRQGSKRPFKVKLAR